MVTAFMFSDFIATFRDLHRLGVVGSVLFIVTFANPGQALSDIHGFVA